jgi:hypothetical protein
VSEEGSAAVSGWLARCPGAEKREIRSRDSAFQKTQMRAAPSAIPNSASRSMERTEIFISLGEP